MDIVTQASSLALVKQVLDFRHPTQPKIPSVPQKPPFNDALGIASPFPRSTPEAHGVSSDYLAEYLTAVADERSIDPHTILILRDGEVISEGAFGAYRSDVWCITHSECKSITGLAIGMLIDEGKLSLDDRIAKIFEKRQYKLAKFIQKDITVRNLLTMSSGVTFNECGTVTETDWVKCYLESVVKFEPGTRFAYNSMNTYMLSAILHEVTGEGLMDYLRPRLWEPLEITQVHWETCPKGIEKGGMGLYIRPEDIAKVGQLFLQKGVWKGKRLVSEKWIEEATSAQITAPGDCGDYNYGYQLWTGRRIHSFLFNGMFGQNVFGFPDSNIVLACTSGNDELFQQSHFFALTHKYFGRAFDRAPLPENPAAHARLLAVEAGLRRRDYEPKPVTVMPRGLLGRLFGAPRQEIPSGLPQECAALDGRRYCFAHAKCGGIGLLPLFDQAVQNNYTRGLDSIAFSVEEGKFYLTVNELDESYRLPVGFGPAEYTELVFHGERQRVGVQGKFTANEDDLPVLKLRVSFLEIANSRLLKLFFSGDTVRVRWAEQPGKNYLYAGFESVVDGVSTNAVYDMLLNKIGPDTLLYLVDTAFEPESVGTLQK